jgi:hypothetical protein
MGEVIFIILYITWIIFIIIKSVYDVFTSPYMIECKICKNIYTPKHNGKSCGTCGGILIDPYKGEDKGCLSISIENNQEGNLSLINQKENCKPEYVW